MARPPHKTLGQDCPHHALLHLSPRGGIPGTECNPFEFLALAWPWLNAAGAMKSRTGREVLVSLGIAACAGDEVGHCSYGDGGIHSEQDLESFLGLASQWLGLHENRNGVRPCVSHFGGWCPFKSWAVFKGDNCKAAMLSRFAALPVSLTQTVSPFQTTT